jgi:hypothetical protein
LLRRIKIKQETLIVEKKYVIATTLAAKKK